MLPRSRSTHHILRRLPVPIRTAKSTPHPSKMSSFTIEAERGVGQGIRVELPAGSPITQEQLLSFPPFKAWLATLGTSLSAQTSQDHPFHDEPYNLRRIDIQAVDIFGGGRIGFIKMQTDVSNDKGEWLPGAVFLRGASVAVMVSMISI
jgi:ADP-sugar diphosphatase